MAATCTVAWGASRDCLTYSICGIQQLIGQAEAVEQGPLCVGALSCEHAVGHILQPRQLDLGGKVTAAVVDPGLRRRALEHEHHPAGRGQQLGRAC